MISCVTRIGLILALALAIALGACSTPPGASRVAPAPPSNLASVAAADPAAPDVTDTSAALTAYAQEHADEFAGMYLDPPGSSHFVMLFTANVDQHAAAVAAIDPGATVRSARFTEAELREILESAMRAMTNLDGVELLFGAVDTIRNVVTIEVKTDDPTFELRTELQYGGRVDVTAHPVPGPWQNATGGEGWRLLASGRASASEAYRVRAATSDREWTDLWAAIGLGGRAPDVDLATEVVVTFAQGIGSGCTELRLDGVAIGDRTVFSQTSDPLAPRACTADLAGAAIFVVAVERSALPPDGFVLQLSEQPTTCADCGFTERIEVDLP
jgi:hypothetical protein